MTKTGFNYLYRLIATLSIIIKHLKKQKSPDLIKSKDFGLRNIHLKLM